MHPYPNPARVYKGVTMIHFTGLTAQVSVAIYTVDIRHVITLEETSPGDIIWDLKNQDGVDVGSDLYIWIATDKKTGNRKIGRLAVVR